MQLFYLGMVLLNLRYFLYNLKVLNIVRFIITNEKVNKICKYTFVTYEVKVWISKLRCSQNYNETKIDSQVYVDYTNFEVLYQCVVIKFSNVESLNSIPSLRDKGFEVNIRWRWFWPRNQNRISTTAIGWTFIGCEFL